MDHTKEDLLVSVMVYQMEVPIEFLSAVLMVATKDCLMGLQLGLILDQNCRS